MPDWLSAWWFALGPAVTLIVLLGVVQACRMRRHKTAHRPREVGYHADGATHAEGPA